MFDSHGERTLRAGSGRSGSGWTKRALACREYPRRTLPDSVNAMCAPVRSKSWTPMSSSSALIWRLTAGCVRCSSSAALRKLCSSATALKATTQSVLQTPPHSRTRRARWPGNQLANGIRSTFGCEHGCLSRKSFTVASRSGTVVQPGPPRIQIAHSPGQSAPVSVAAGPD
jgi:hypothetical protein